MRLQTGSSVRVELAFAMQVQEQPVLAHRRQWGFRSTGGYDLTERAGWTRPNPIFFASADLWAA